MNNENMKAMASIAIDRYNREQEGSDKDRILLDRQSMEVVGNDTVIMENHRERVVITRGRFDSQFKVISREFFQR